MRRFVVAAVLPIIASMAYGGSALHIDPHAVFEELPLGTGVFPVSVELSNDGPDAVGALSVESYGSAVEYPVELPRGAHKRLMVFPTGLMGEVKLDLITNRGRESGKLAPNRSSGWGRRNGNILLIGESAGSMSFLRGPERPQGDTAKNSYPQEQIQYQDVYGRAGECPTRPVGYQSILAIVLGHGSERLSNEEVSAIKDWVLTGGTVIFPGGASPAAQSDPRWSALMPWRKAAIRTYSADEAAEKLGQSGIGSSVTLAIGEALPGATWKHKASAERQVGLGRVVALSYDPFESPLNRWEPRRTLLLSAVHEVEGLRARQFLATYSNSSQDDDQMSSGSWSSAASDPFSIQLPKPDAVYTLLAAYFFLVVPVTFLVLRKLKRGELAWFVAPVISVSFAAMVLSSAKDLYGAQLSTRTKSIILMSPEISHSMLIGRSDIFFPHGGAYDLKMTGVDSLIGTSNDEYMAGMDRNTLALHPVDVGEVRMPEVGVNNLSFQTIGFRQIRSETDWITAKVIERGRGRLKVQVENRSPYALEGKWLIYGWSRVDLGRIAAGDTKTLWISAAKQAPPEDQRDTYRKFMSKSNGIAVVGDLIGFRPGAQVGREVGKSPACTVMAFASLMGGTL